MENEEKTSGETPVQEKGKRRDDRRGNDSGKAKGKSQDAVNMVVRTAELSAKVKELEEKVGTLEKENADLKNQMLLVRADAENYRKRIDREKESYVSYANEGIVKDMLPALDSLDIALQGMEQGSFRDGIELVRTSVLGSLGKWGLEKTDSAGKEFDPSECEACLFEESEEVEFDTVLEVLQAGYRLHGKVIRPAKVKILKKV